MDINISLPLDGGFLRRQCPSCDRQFKWHNGPAEGRPPDATDPPFYHCPYCGEPAGPDDWWTNSQIEYAEQIAVGPLVREVTDGLEGIAKGINSEFISLSFEAGEAPEPPVPLVEPSDMMAVESPCHPWEPVKVDDAWRSPIHCLVCGTKYTV